MQSEGDKGGPVAHVGSTAPLATPDGSVGLCVRGPGVRTGPGTLLDTDNLAGGVAHEKGQWGCPRHHSQVDSLGAGSRSRCVR